MTPKYFVPAETLSKSCVLGQVCLWYLFTASPIRVGGMLTSFATQDKASDSIDKNGVIDSRLKKSY